MAAELIFAPEVEQDISEAYNWYEEHRIGLGEDFLGRIASIQAILRNPNMFAPVHENYRRALTRQFPYAFFTSI